MLLIIVGGVLMKSLFLLLAEREVGYTVAQVGTELRLETARACVAQQVEKTFCINQWAN